MEEKVREMVELKQRSMAEDSQKTLEALKDRYAKSAVILPLVQNTYCFRVGHKN